MLVGKAIGLEYSPNLPINNPFKSRGLLLQCLGWCAKAVYGDVTSAQMCGHAGTWEPISGLTQLQFFGSGNGIQAATFINSKWPSVAIISFRGTETFLSGMQDLAFLAPPIPQLAVNAACEYYRRVRRETSYSHVYVTGHSLGGFLAEGVASYENVQGAAFNSPGPWNMYTGSYRPHFEIHLASSDPVAYLFPTPQNSKHIGTPQWHDGWSHSECYKFLPSEHEFKSVCPTLFDPYKAPYYVVYRSNHWGSSWGDDAAGLRAESKHWNMGDAFQEYYNKRDAAWAYGVCDADGHVIDYIAATTSSFQDQYCRAAVRKYR